MMTGHDPLQRTTSLLQKAPLSLWKKTFLCVTAVAITSKLMLTKFPSQDRISPTTWTHIAAAQHEYVDKASPACQPSFGGKHNISRVYFAHTRKAGGTTILDFLQKTTKALNYELVVYEAGRYGTSRTDNKVGEQEYPNREDTLYVTNLRDPVDRIISDYKYAGRWKCNQLVNNKNGFVPSLENQRSLEDDVQILNKYVNRSNCKGKHILWRCAEECYTRWYGKNFNCIHNYTSDSQTAFERLMKYDIIVITDWLKNPDYVKRLESLFGDTNVAPGTLSGKREAWCAKESYEWNAKLPMGAINDETRVHLHRLNRHDTQLYEKITHCPGGVVFPEALEQELYLNTSSKLYLR